MVDYKGVIMENNEEIKDSLNGNEINGTNDSIDFYYLIGILFKYKKFIFSITFVVAVLSIIYALLTTPYYISVATIYPVNKDDGGPLKQLSASLGISNRTQGYYIFDVLNSRRIITKIIYSKYKTSFSSDSVNLIQFWKLDKIDISENRKLEVAMKLLRSKVTMKEDKETALINISAITKDKLLSKSIVVKHCDETINYLNNEEQNSVKQSIQFTINRLDVVKNNLLQTENEIIEFQEENATISSPLLSMELRRKTKNMELARSVVVLLEKQLELLKIEEVRDRPIINILDTPGVRDKPV
ncbi:MAG: hypothetical protein KAS62_02035, partial [Candidatus Delongbacteria bacterium]|nr:hypothetical protein [Candidatus Delongbacteria bacterium]